MDLLDFLPIVEKVTGRSLAELQQAFKEGWRGTEVNDKLLQILEEGVASLREWVKKAEEEKYSTLEEGRSKLADYEAVVEAIRKMRVTGSESL
ncbi:MAG: hypothetical protein Q8R13_02685 [bacterium]|nr:hypothetical protein [bacterium]MDZ4296520.1 hypothetical protein [Patescibacteria group bacterium]